MSFPRGQNISYGLLHGLRKTDLVQFVRYLTASKDGKGLAFMIPTALIDLRSEGLKFYMEDCHQRILEIEKKTRIFCDDTTRRAASLHSEPTDLINVDLNTVSRDLTSVSSELAYTMYSARGHISLLEFLTKSIVSLLDKFFFSLLFKFFF